MVSDLDGIEAEVIVTASTKTSEFSQTVLQYVIQKINGAAQGSAVIFWVSTQEKGKEVIAAFTYAKNNFMIRPCYLQGGLKVVAENGKFRFGISKVGKPWSQEWAEAKTNEKFS